MKKSILFFSLILLAPLTKAQTMWEVGLFTGLSAYSGDINPTVTPRLKDITPSLGLMARTNFSRRLGLRASFTYLVLKGDDSNFDSRKSRDFDFNTRLFELGILGEWEPLGNEHYYSDAAGNVILNRLISPYLFGGVGLIGGRLNTNFSNYKGSNENTISGIKKDKAFGNSLAGVSLPLGAGVKFNFSKVFSIALEGSMRMSFTDYLDGISYSASTEGKDFYMNGGFILYYRFGGVSNAISPSSTK